MAYSNSFKRLRKSTKASVRIAGPPRLIRGPHEHDPDCVCQLQAGRPGGRVGSVTALPLSTLLSQLPAPNVEEFTVSGDLEVSQKMREVSAQFWF
jgi:hypothetical protein